MTAALALGLLSAILYGTTDFLARFSGRAIGVLRTMFYGQLLAGAMVSIWLGFQAEPSNFGHEARNVWTLTIGSNLIVLAATGLLFRALQRGSLAIVAPIAASYGAVAALLSLAVGEDFTPSLLVGIALVAIGAILVAKPPTDAPRQRDLSGIGPATGAAFCFGLGFWIQGRYAVPQLGPVLPVWSYYMTGLASLLAIAAFGRRSLRPPTWREAPAVFGTGALAGGGYLALVAGQATGAVALVTVLSSLASAVTVILARFLLGERISVLGWSGLASVLLGLMLIKL